MGTMRSQPQLPVGPTWPPSLDALEKMCDAGLVRRTFIRLHPQKRLRVLNAALAQAAAQGPGRLNIKLVAEQAGIPVGSLYRYFGGREALVRFTCALASQRLEAVLGIASPILSRLPLADGVREYLTRSIAWCRSEPVLLRIYVAAGYTIALRHELQRSPSDDPDQMIAEGIADTVQKVMRSFVEAARLRGELRSDVDTEDACRILNVLLIALIDAALLPGLNAYYRLFDDVHGTKRIIDAAVDVVCRGMLAQTPARTKDEGPFREP